MKGSSCSKYLITDYLVINIILYSNTFMIVYITSSTLAKLLLARHPYNFLCGTWQNSSLLFISSYRDTSTCSFYSCIQISIYLLTCLSLCALNFLRLVRWALPAVYLKMNELKPNLYFGCCIKRYY